MKYFTFLIVLSTILTSCGLANSGVNTDSTLSEKRIFPDSGASFLESENNLFYKNFFNLPQHFGNKYDDTRPFEKYSERIDLNSNYKEQKSIEFDEVLSKSCIEDIYSTNSSVWHYSEKVKDCPQISSPIISQNYYTEINRIDGKIKYIQHTADVVEIHSQKKSFNSAEESPTPKWSGEYSFLISCSGLSDGWDNFFIIIETSDGKRLKTPSVKTDRGSCLSIPPDDDFFY